MGNITSQKALVAEREFVQGMRIVANLSDKGLAADHYGDSLSAYISLLEAPEDPKLAVVDFAFRPAEEQDTLQLLEELDRRAVPTIIISTFDEQEFDRYHPNTTRRAFLSKPFTEESFGVEVSKILRQD